MTPIARPPAWTASQQGTTWQWWNRGTSTASTLQASTWENWIGTATSSAATGAYGYYVPATWTVWNQAYEETREQAEQRKERQREHAERERERQRTLEAERAAYQAERAAASARAEELLLSLLTDEQTASYITHGWFEVRGSRGGRWRIRRRGQVGNVDLMPEIGDIRQATFCCYPPGGLPNADAHAAQMLHLVTDEDGFRRTANQVHGHMAAA